MRTFPVAGLCSIPSQAKAVALNFTVVSPTDFGDLRVYPAGLAMPQTSSINFRPGKVQANNEVVSLGTSGAISVQCDMASGSTNLLIDVSGYYR